MFVAAMKRSIGNPDRFAISPAVRLPKFPLGVLKMSAEDEAMAADAALAPGGASSAPIAVTCATA